MGSNTIVSAVARKLAGKVALITGGVSGIGSSTAKLFCQHGAKVVITDVQDDLGDRLCKDLGPSNCSFIHCDVTKEQDVKNAVDQTMAEHGKLDIMFNNAGITGRLTASVIDSDVEDLMTVLRVNAMGVFLGTKHAARVMKPAGKGNIINTASVASIVGGVTPCAYTCSKHAVLGLTKNTAVELGKLGIRVNCVSPYFIETPMTRGYFELKESDTFPVEYSTMKGATLATEDVANGVLYLASDDSNYMNGHNLVIDGGFTIENGALSIYS